MIETIDAIIKIWTTKNKIAFAGDFISLDQ